MGNEDKFLERLNQLFDADPRTDTAIGDALGVSKQTICYWRQGERSPKRSVLEKIAKMYGVSPAWLLGWDEHITNGQIQASAADLDRLEALHQNPRLGLLFDRQRRMSGADVEFMLEMSERILRERDGE